MQRHQIASTDGDVTTNDFHSRSVAVESCFTEDRAPNRTTLHRSRAALETRARLQSPDSATVAAREAGLTTIAAPAKALGRSLRQALARSHRSLPARRHPELRHPRCLLSCVADELRPPRDKAAGIRISRGCRRVRKCLMQRAYRRRLR